MPRNPRIQYAGAVYHVMCRGDRQEAIFEDDRDRAIFLETLGEACARTGWKVLSYVLMGNHYHLLLETPEANLVRGMPWFQGTYTARFNARHRQRGHVFQGRYKAIPVETQSEDYGRMVSDYIHLNPARAGLIEKEGRLRDYRWSSFPIICAGRAKEAWLDCERVLIWSHARGGSASSRRTYGQEMEKRAKECLYSSKQEGDEWRELRRGWFIGGEGLREKLEAIARKVVKEKKRESYKGAALRGHDEEEALTLWETGLAALGLDSESVRNLPQNDARKQGLAWLVKSRTVVGDQWVSARMRFGHRSNISRALTRMRTSGEDEVRKVKKRLAHICTD